jgi:hypothetical protein
MSCLYSSPEVTSLEVISLDVKSLGLSLSSGCRCYGIVGVMVASPDPARLMRTESQRSSTSQRFLSYVAVNKDAFPNSPAYAAGCIKSFSLPKQAQVSCVSF